MAPQHAVLYAGILKMLYVCVQLCTCASDDAIAVIPPQHPMQHMQPLILSTDGIAPEMELPAHAPRSVTTDSKLRLCLHTEGQRLPTHSAMTSNQILLRPN